MEVGFVGLGAMGRPMAQHLQRAGHRLHLWARRPESVASFEGTGAVVHATPAELAAATDVAFTIVTTSEDVERVALGEGGFVEGARPGWVHVDMSTIAPGTTRRIAAALAVRGAAMLDAPVSGGSVAAEAGTVAMMVGGDAAVLERVRPLLATFSRAIVHVGDNGAGEVAKACNQMVMVAAIQACAEAMLLAQAHGVDAAKVREALMGGSASSRMLDVMGDRMIRRDFAAGIEARLHHKDFGILMDEAARLGTPLPVAAQVWQQLNALMSQGGAHDDTSGLLRVVERASGRGAD
ncbi:NAD(P)-dependent oxidoreductase [Aromatoleum petrolei]|uniref:NAD-binding protein n=1 Tax=Aromatoleum petrolei TaxID=76116 RepID=A0ABX1MPZ5_9RHOO|nr:NAD(P)-dependent oxidoreductase [Aromatoleum petrolei]NMF88771.1 NAD-binding protein [Aromatoleum petrolei]QTQ36052.1 putative 6-phosphogluconate dehydrogenase [Aromatoleum petrolei]